MIEIQVPKDITTYKTKTVGPLTMRQLVILMLVIAMDFLLYTAVLKDRNLSAEAIMYIAALIDTPVFAFMFEIYGMPMEKLILIFLLCNVLAPGRRIYTGSLRKEADVPISQKKEKQIRKLRKRMIRESRKKETLKIYK